MSLYKNKYRNESFRHPSWDYARCARYFVTMNTKNRVRYFGEIRNKEMVLTEIGLVAQSEWKRIPDVRPDMNIKLDEFIVMPDHIHGIIIIGNNEYNSCGDTMHGVPTLHGAPTLHGVPTGSETTNGTFGPQRKNLASIIRGYKSAVTIFARKNNIEFNWQSLYHDHIIRDIRALDNIRNYIRNNPANWKEGIESEYRSA